MVEHPPKPKTEPRRDTRGRLIFVAVGAAVALIVIHQIAAQVPDDARMLIVPALGLVAWRLLSR